MKILVCCAGGMSSSLLVQKMREEVKNKNLETIKIGACSKDQLHRYANEADIILVAPQLHFIIEEIQDIGNQYHCQVFNISREDYGNLEASSIIDNILYNHHDDEAMEDDQSVSFITKLYPFAKWIAANRYLSALSEAFISIMPVTMVGSFVTLLKCLPIPNYENWLSQNNLDTLLDLCTGATIDMISLFAAFFICYHLVKSYNIDGHGAGLISLTCFFLITGRTNGRYSTEYFSSKGLFTVIIISFIVARIYVFIIQKHWTIHSPARIPKQVAHAFHALVPTLVIVSLFLVLTGLMTLTKYHDFHTMIYSLIQSNLMKFMGNNIFSYVFFQFAINSLWFLGLHGGNIVGSVTNPIYTSLSLENLAAFQRGDPLPNIINGAFAKCFIQGGVGSMLSLSIIMVLFARSQKYKAFGKISLPTCIFYINEPLIFGIPIVLNPLFFIPLFITTPVLSILTYFVMRIGLIPPANGVQLPWTTPPIIYGLLQGSWKIALWEVITIFISGMIWYPFFKAADNQALEDENNPCHN